MKKINWQTVCYRFVLENRKLYFFEQKKAPQTVIDYQQKLIQSIYNEMRDACLADKTYMDQWENAPVTKAEMEKKFEGFDSPEEFGSAIPI